MKCILNSKLADSPEVDSATKVVNISLSLDAYPQQTGFRWISHYLTTYRCTITIRKSLPGLRKKGKKEIQRSNTTRVFILM